MRAMCFGLASATAAIKKTNNGNDAPYLGRRPARSLAHHSICPFDLDVQAGSFARSLVHGHTLEGLSVRRLSSLQILAHRPSRRGNSNMPEISGIRATLTRRMPFPNEH